MSIRHFVCRRVHADPEYTRQYETGVKSSWLDERLSTTLSAYQIERFNIRYRPDAQNNPYTWAVGGKHRSRGVELSAIGQIIPQKLYLRGSLGVMQAKVVEDKENPNRVGIHLENTSNVTGNLFFRYTPTENLYGENRRNRYGQTLRLQFEPKANHHASRLRPHRRHARLEPQKSEPYFRRRQPVQSKILAFRRHARRAAHLYGTGELQFLIPVRKQNKGRLKTRNTGFQTTFYFL